MLKVQRKREAAIPNPKFRPTMEQIRALERDLAAHPARIMSLHVVHHFAPGLYAREMHIPAGVMLTGATHKTGHLCTLNSGDLSVCSEGGEWVRLSPGQTFESLPGAKRVGFAHTDVVFTTYHPTTETDIAKIEADLVVPGADQPLDGLLPPTFQEKLT